MKKLNQTELHVLSGRILADLRAAARKAQTELDVKTLPSRQKRAKLISLQMKATNKAINGLLKSLKKETGGYYNTQEAAFGTKEMSVKYIANKLKETQTSINLPVPRYYHESDQIFNALVIAQISCPDVESLVEMVAQQFTIKT